MNGANIHDLSDDDFDAVAKQFESAGIQINCFGSTIANWGKSIEAPFDDSWEAAKRAVPRMQRLGTSLIRIMSFAVLEDRGP
ncbi:MAG: sugar phosphate isomerase/epimerase, partial [Verrucomicrobia bacterium]|nr:sugar phosphate isomerase/epimerase [Verrucomicrobiota bacterium]